MKEIFKKFKTESHESMGVNYYSEKTIIEMFNALSQWISVENELPDWEEGEVLGYNSEWLDEDYNPECTRICFRNDGAENGWTSAKWCGLHDEYHTDDETAPTKWKRLFK